MTAVGPLCSIRPRSTLSTPPGPISPATEERSSYRTTRRSTSRDGYRIGKSLRRKGFETAALDDLDAVASRANLLLAKWVEAGGAAHIECDGPALADRRAWVCALPEATVRIPCGGTHVASLAELSSVTVSLASTPVEGGFEVVMTTVAAPA